MHRDYQPYLDAAIRAAYAAGELIRARLGAYATLETKSSANDLVTDVDRACERVIGQHLLEAFPSHLILGEEGATGAAARHDQANDPSAVPFLWVCDPIDGTTNFVHGIPACTVAIALALYGEVVVGVVYDPMRDELFAASRGRGATLNGKPMRVRSDRFLAESLLATGFSTTETTRSRNLAGMVALAPHCRNIRAMGSAQLHLAYVAAGRLSGFWEVGLSPWDMAAGYVLVTEAGGQATTYEGDPWTLRSTGILTSNGPIHGALLEVLRPF